MNTALNSLLGVAGTSLAMITPNELISILAGLATLVYMVVNLIKEIKK